MELYLIRHGQSTSNRGDVRVADPPLTDLGREQALRAGAALSEIDIARLYCSPMLRALQTATIIGEFLDLAPHVFVGLHEWGGIWEDRGNSGREQLPGLTRSGVHEICPTAVLPDDITNEGWWFRKWEGIEPAPSWNDKQMMQLANENALAFIAHLERHHATTDESVAVVSHGASASTLIGTFFGLQQDDDNARFVHYNAAISMIHRTPERTQLLYLNRIAHLSKEMVTW